jgi:hypothetical protein
MIGMRSFRRVVVGVVVSVVPLIVLVGVAPAHAGSVWWGLTSGSWPSSLPANGTGKIIVTAENLGTAGANGGAVPMVLEDTLPEHLEVVQVKGVPQVEGVAGEPEKGVHYRGPVTCSSSSPHQVRCEFKGLLPSYEEIEVRIAVTAVEASSSDENTVSVSGGGGDVGTLTRPIGVGAGNGFGVEDFKLIPEEEGGAVSTQAGVHPFQLTSVLALDTSEAAADVKDQEPAGLVKDLAIELPPGLIGNPTPLAQCTDAQFSRQESGTKHDECEAQTAIGVVTVANNVGGGPYMTTVPLFNLTPLVGEPARFGFEVDSLPVTLDTSVRSGSDYGVTVKVSNIQEATGFLTSKVTFWGVPGSPAHDDARGWACIEGEKALCGLAESEPPPFLSLPTSCTGSLRTTVQADSWAEPYPARPLEAPLFDEYEIGGLDGCNHLQFDPEISVAPDVPDASTATGLSVRVHVPQTAALNPEGLAESALRNTTVALPPGVAVNPGGADGLEACSESEIGYQGKEPGEADTNLFTAGLPSPFCPDGSKIGTVEIETPLLPHALKGAVYLAEQNANPFSTLLAMYLVAEDPVSGTLLKLPGAVALNQETGQLVTTFNNTPPLPFENLRLHFFGESRAPLGTPALCQPYTTQATFSPWSGNEPSHVFSTFDITSGPNGAPCHDPLPFAPSLTAGSVNNQAGALSPFTLTMSREDGNQNLKSIELHMPPGLSGVLTNVPLCSEPQADEGLCPQASQIGETTVSVGLGGNPFTVKGGRVYLTGPYKGAPFGLSIVNPAKAGPFDVEDTPAHHPACDCLVVRAKLEVNPTTAAVTVTSDENGPYAIPPIIEGIPLQIQHINVTIDRPGGFTFNPTNCNPLQITGTLDSIEGAIQTLPVSFQATNCATLQFTPKFTATTSGKTSKANGASLAVKLAYPNAPQGSQANISMAKVELPKQLPSRLTTLQKACTAAQFETNPAGCPPASIIGHAKATTPILPVALEGPAYFVSHGGEAFPSLIVVLHGYGVSVNLVGTTFINKAGITSSTFKTVPDVPVGTFELTLPQGPYSALAANGNLCTSKLAMPTEFVAQNGATIHESTKIGVTGCPRIKALTRAQKLTAALKACRKKARGHKRAACETRARKQYGPIEKAKKGAVRKRK